jgi:hypothetical protein
VSVFPLCLTKLTGVRFSLIDPVAGIPEQVYNRQVVEDAVSTWHSSNRTYGLSAFDLSN